MVQYSTRYRAVIRAVVSIRGDKPAPAGNGETPEKGEEPEKDATRGAGTIMRLTQLLDLFVSDYGQRFGKRLA